MKLQKFRIYLADLNPVHGTEPGKIRPVVIVQTDLLNNEHPSTVVCPTTTRIVKEVSVLRVHLSRKESGLSKDSDILIDQIRAIDNRRFLRPLGKLSVPLQEKLLENLRLILLE